MSAPTLTTTPASIRAGDTATWLLELADYPASGGWSVEYNFVNAAGKFTIASTAEGSAHRLRADPATTTAYPVGTYGWHCRVTDGTDAFTVGSGSTEVLPDLASATTLDTRSHAQKTLAALESWIEGHDLAVAEYEIANRRMKHIPITDLLKLRDQYRREVRGASGKSGRVYVRF